MDLWAITQSGAPLQKLTLPDPVPQGAEVVVAVTHCGVCHSDLHLWKGEYNLGQGRVLRLADRGVTLPRAPGHEIVGRVVAVGPDAEGVAPGDLRIVYPWIGCGSCVRCAAGEDNLCASQSSLGIVRHGGFGSHVVVPHARYLVDPGDLDPALAATFACSGITVLSAIRKLGQLPPDEIVVLIGGGGLGHAAIAMLQALGHQKIMVVDPDPAKRQAALAAGAILAIDAGSNATDGAAAIRTAAGGPVFHIIDFVNNSATAATAQAALGKGGTLVMIGIAGGELVLSLATMIFMAQRFIGSNTGSVQDLRDVVALAQAGRLKPIRVECCPADAANDALLRLKSGQVIGRLVLQHPPRS